MAFIPALGAIVTSFVGAAVSTTLGTALAAMGATAVGIGAIVAGGVLANKLISSLYEMPKMDTDASRQRTVKGTIEPQKIIYGENLVSGPLSFVGTYGDTNRVLAHAVVLAGHEVHDITDIYFDDEVISDSQINSSGYVTSGKFGPVGNKSFTFGVTNFGTNICKINRYKGASGQTADADLVSNFTSYTSSHIGTGLAYITTHWLLKDGSQKTWDQYAPRDIKAIVKGKKVYDPRTGLTAYSDNPALCVADYLTDTKFGLGVASSKIDWTAVSTAANACDVLVDVPNGTEKRFTCNGVLFATDSHKTNINKLLSSMNGMVSYTNGKYVIRAGAFETATISLNEDNLIGAVSVKTSFERSDRFNTVTGTFIDPAQNYKATEFPEVQITSALLRDNSEVLVKDIQLPMTNSSYMAQRIANKLIQISDQQKVVTFPTNLAGIQIAVGDRVNVSLAEFNWVSKDFICLGWTFSDSGNGGVNLLLREDDAGSYADPSVASYSTVSATGAIITGFRGYPDPQNLTATAGLKNIELNWDNPDNMSEIEQIEVFASADENWANAVKIGSVSGTQFTHDLANPIDPVDINDTRYYWVRARGYSVGDGDDAVSDRNPDGEVSGIFATVGVIQWEDLGGAGLPDDNANNTYIDGSGNIQGVSQGAGTSVDNVLNAGKTLALLLNQSVSGAVNSGECSLVGVDNEGNIDRAADGYVLWNGSKITVERYQYQTTYTILTQLAGRRGFICFDTTKSDPFTVQGVGMDVAFVYKQGNQWYYDNNASASTFTPTDDMVALGWLETGSADSVVRGGLFGEPVSLTTASFPSDIIESGSIGGVSVDATKIYAGTGDFNNANTGFYLDNTGQFSLKNKLSFDGTDLVVDGGVKATTLDVIDATVTGTLNASSVSAGSIVVESLSQSVWNAIDERFTTVTGSTGGFYATDTGYFSGTQITIPTPQVAHNTQDVVLQIAIDQYWVSATNLSGTALDAVVTYEYSTDNINWSTVTNGTSNATTTITASNYAFSYGGETSNIYYLTTGYSFTMPYAQLSAGNYYFRVRITPSATTNAFQLANYLPNGGIEVVFEANETVSGTISTGGSADTLDGLNSTQFLRSDVDDTFEANLTITGNLTVNGTTTTLNTATLDVEDKNITLNYGAGDTSASANGAGITIQDAVNSTTDATILWSTSNDTFDFSHSISTPFITLSNKELSDAPTAYSIWLDANDTSAPASLGSYAGTYPMGIYVNGDNGTSGGSLGAGAVQVYHTGHFSGTNISNWETAYSWGNHADVGYLTSGEANLTGDVTIFKTGTATSTTTDYPSYDLFFNASGWDTSQTIARDVGFTIRGESVSSVYPDFSLAFYEGPTNTYTQKKFELYGYGIGDQDPRAGTFYGHLDVHPTSDGTGGDFKINGITTITSSRDILAQSYDGYGRLQVIVDSSSDYAALLQRQVTTGTHSLLYGSLSGVLASNSSTNDTVLTTVQGSRSSVVAVGFSNQTKNISITNVVGSNISLQMNDLGGGSKITVGSSYGVLIETPITSATTSLTNAYGLYIEDHSGKGSTGSYSIYSEGGDNYLGGNLTLAGTLSASGYNKTNWDTAYGWGDHDGLYELVTEQTATNINNSGTDMTGLDDGWYKWGSTKPTDAPFNYASMLQLSDTNQKIQMAFGSASRGRLAIRRADSGTFYNWTSVWTDADFSSTKISNWDTAYAYSQVGHLPLDGGVITGTLGIDDFVYIARTGIATSTQNYPSHSLHFQASGWDTNNATQRSSGFFWRAEADSSIYPNFRMSLYEETESYGHKKVDFHGLGSGSSHQDSKSATFYGDVSVNPNSDGQGGNLSINGTLVISTSRNLLNINSIDINSGTDTALTVTHDSFANGLIVHRNNASFAAAIKFSNNSGTNGILYATNAGELVWRDLDTTNAYTIFHDNYHPNADAWTTARTLSLTGDVTGSVSIDGSADASITATVANDSHTHDTQYYTKDQVKIFWINGYVDETYTGSNLAVGWYTIATNGGNRATAKFGIRDIASSRHQAVTFYAAHHYGNDDANTITVIDNSYFGISPIRYIRIKDADTYDGAALQVYIDDPTNAVSVFMLGENFQAGNWELCNWVPDATTPPLVSNYGNFTQKKILDLDEIGQGGLGKTGNIYSGGTVISESGYGFGSGTLIDSNRRYQNLTAEGINYLYDGVYIGGASTFKGEVRIYGDDSIGDYGIRYQPSGILPAPGTTYDFWSHFRSDPNGILHNVKIDELLDVVGGVQINGTTVIDSSRNLTNIGTINGSTISNWDTAYGWGDHAGLYLLASTMYNNTHLGLVYNANMTIGSDGHTISKIASDNSWNGHVYSTLGLTGGCVFRYSPTNTDRRTMVGINTDPTTDSNYTSLDFSFYIQVGGSLNIYESGSSKGSFGTYAVGDDLAIIYDNDKIRYYHNNSLIRTVDVDAGLTFYFDSSFYDTYTNYTQYLIFEPYVEKDDFNKVDILGTTVIDSSRNLTNVADANFGGDVTINSTNAAAKYLRINKGTGDGGILWELSDALKFQNVISGDDLNWYSYELGQTSFTMYGSGQFSARNGYMVNGTTVIDSSRNLTNIGSISASGNITADGTLTVNASGTPTLAITDTYNAGGGGAAGVILFKNTAGNAIGIGYTGDETSNSNLLISNNAGGTYGGYLGLDANAISDTTSDIILEPKTNVVIATGNLLVGTTSLPTDDNTSLYFGVSSTGEVRAAVNNGNAAMFKRASTDGDIVEFRKDANLVGSIGVRQSDLIVGTGDTGVQFYDFGDAIFPINVSTGGNRDAAIDLGESSNRFKDLYLSGYIKADSGYQVGTTTVIDSSRNLTNIGTISSGTITATGDLTVTGDMAVGAYIFHAGDTNSYLRFVAADDVQLVSGGRQMFRMDEGADPDVLSFVVSTTYTDSNGNIVASGDVTAYASDKRLKTNIKTIDSALDKISKMRGVTYDWIDNIEDLGFNPERKHDCMGVIAQEVEEAGVDQVIKLAPFDRYRSEETNWKFVSKSGEDYKTVDYDKLTALCIQGIKEQQEIIDSQQSQIDELKALVKQLLEK